MTGAEMKGLGGVSVQAWGTAGLVPGLRVRMTADELRSHLRARSSYHAKRETEKSALLPQLEDAAEKIKAQQPAALVAQFSKSTGNYRFDADDAVDNLRRDVEDHHNKSVAFAFLAEHVFPQDYCLDRSDLVSLEILKS